MEKIKFNPDLESEGGMLYRRYCEEKGIDYSVLNGAMFCLGYMAVKPQSTSESPAEQPVVLTQERADFIREVNGRDLGGMKEQPVRDVVDWISVDERLPELTEPLTWWDDETNQRDVIIPNHHAIVLAYNLELGVYKAKLEGKTWSEISSRSNVSTKETIPTHWKPLPKKPAEWSGEKEREP